MSHQPLNTVEKKGWFVAMPLILPHFSVYAHSKITSSDTS